MCNFDIPLYCYSSFTAFKIIYLISKKNFLSCSSRRHLQKLEPDCLRGVVLSTLQIYRDLLEWAPQFTWNVMFKGSCG